MSDNVWRDEKPMERLTRMCDAAIQAFEGHPEYREGDKAIVFLDDVAGNGGIVIHGWPNDTEAMGALFYHLKAVFKANGINIDFIPLEQPIGEG